MNPMRAVIMLAMVAWGTGTGYGQGADAVLDLLLRKGVITTQDVNEVRAKLDADMAKLVAQYQKPTFPKWIEQMTFSGDLRLRAEQIQFEPGLNLPDRNRFRFRLRLGLETQFTDWAGLGFRLASGDGNPVSNNLTFTDTFRNKLIYIDQAYLTLQPPGCDGVKLIAGKMPTPIWQPSFASSIGYDADVTPEGLAEQLTYKFGDKKQHRLFAHFGQFAAKEFGSDANDVYFFDCEAGGQATIGNVRATVAGGYSFTHNLDRLRVGDSPLLGNSVALVGTSTNFLADFNVAYGRADLELTVRNEPLLGTPCLVTFSGEYLKNLSGAYESLAGAITPVDPDQTDGWQAQVMFGRAKKKGQWQLIYAYKYIEADAMWDAITDSDFGSGGTDQQGHIIKAAYNVQDWWQLWFTAYIAQKISDRPNTGHNRAGIPGEDLLRFQADTTMKF